MLHPSDPPMSTFPLTLQITPSMLDMCRVCSKIPAAVSVTGDMRLGESPCVLCEQCWSHVGLSEGGEEEMTVTPLPKWNQGW
jgi:snRNA-activating protein complex subunit 3